MEKLPITAIVASCNEGHLLEECLKGLYFCSEIFVINLQSEDNTIEIAKKYNTKILNYPRYPIVEEALFHAIPNASHEWILLTDPDEVIDYKLSLKVKDLFSSNEINNFQAIRSPIQFYFKQYALKGTIWGGNNSCRFLFKKENIILTKLVHNGIKIEDTSKIYYIQRNTFDTVVHHYWMSSYTTFFKKINRYIDKEGEKMYKTGNKYTIWQQLKNTISAFKSCYVYCKGYKDGITGIILSLIWSYYTFNSWRSLRRYTKSIK